MVEELGWHTFEAMKHSSATPMRCIPYCHQQFSRGGRARKWVVTLKLFLNPGPVEVELEYSIVGGALAGGSRLSFLKERV